MFFTRAEKVRHSFFGDWRTRTVAFDTRRRYLYYSEPMALSADSEAPETAETSSSPAAVAEAVTPAETTTSAQASLPSPGTEGGSAHQPSRLLTPSATATDTTVVAAPPSTAAALAEQIELRKVIWTKKYKVFGVVPVATVKEFNLKDANFAEKDLYQLEITAESRPLATGETPPVGPLLCASAGLLEVPRRCNVANEEYVQDPFFLKELFNALRDQFEELELANQVAEQAAAAAGRPAASSVPVTTRTITSPRSNVTGKEPAVKKEKMVLRCRNEREFRRFWYVLQMVLGFDKLIVRPYRGLPPYDPRNMVSFAHIPMTVWHTFKALDKAVFYVFTRGDIVGGLMPDQKSVTTALHGCYMCVTHDMVYFMRDTGNIPRWIRLQEVSEFHYNVSAKAPFFAFLSDPPVPDLIFVPLPPVFGPKAQAEFDPVFEVRRMQRVMHDTVFASLAIRRVVRLSEIKDSSVQDYVRRMGRSERPLRLQSGPTYNSAMSCPLPKEQLAAVWGEVQRKLIAMGDVPNRAAIPLYEANALDLQLSREQLSSIEQHLEEERVRRDDVVGIPLERARQVPAAAAAASASPSSPQSSSSSRQRRQQRRSTRRAQRVSNSRHHDPGAAAGVPAAQVLPLTVEMLNTPQLAGTYQGQNQTEQCDSSNPSSSLTSHNRSEFSSYLVPGTRYITREEVEARRAEAGGKGLSTPELEAIGVDRHQEVERGSTVRGAASPSPLTAAGRGGSGGGFVYGPERTVNEIVSESLAALQKKRGE